MKKSKGYSYFDFSIGAALLIILLAFSITYAEARINETDQSSADLVFSLFFENSGIPEDWEVSGKSIFPSLGGTIYRLPLKVEGPGIVRVDVDLKDVKKNSFRAIDGKDKIPIDLKVGTDSDGDGFLESARLAIRIDSASSEIIDLYFSGDDLDEDYTNLEGSNVQVTPLGIEKIGGVYLSKINALEDYDLVREKTGIRENFRLSITGEEIGWIYGPEPSDVVKIKSKTMVMQHDKGIKTVKATVEVW